MAAVLDRKLGRDLWRVKGQALAIVLVMAVGVMMLVMMDGLVNSLSETQRTYYERYRMPQLFAPLKRAPMPVLTELARIPGVATVEGRIHAGALINLPDQALPIRARALSLPDFREPRLGAVYLSAGRPLDPSHRDEILLLEGFAEAHGLAPGDTLAATLNGIRRRFTIVGLAQSPEFIYATPPGEMIPDDSRFAVLWLSETALAAAYDLDGAFNEVLLSLTRDAHPRAVLASLDRQLERYGGTGAYPLADHLSHRFVSEEINSLRLSSRSIPPIFLGVAAFLLYIVISRMVQAERTQIGLLKAFGRTDTEVALHYLKFALAIATAGALVGCALGVLSGRALASFYQVYYKFPFLLFRVDPQAFAISVLASILAATGGGLLVLRQVFALAPAAAMRPPTPPDFSHSLRFGPRLKRWLDQPSRMVLRNLWRQPGRALASVVGIGTGMALSVAMLSVMSAFDSILEDHFTLVDRSQVTVTFVEPLGEQSLHDLARLPGVLRVEPFRSVPALLLNGRHQYRGALTALGENPTLYRALDRHHRAIAPRDDGVILSRSLAAELALTPGDTLTVQVREGRRPTLKLPVAAIVDPLMGSPAYLSLESLGRSLKEPGRVSGAYLAIDSRRQQALYRQLREMPAVAGVSLSADSREAFVEIMDSGAGAMRYIMALLSAIITFGIVYNSARIAFAERAHDLASLRVLGLTRGETRFVLVGELIIITLLSLPLGALAGYYLTRAVSAAFSTDLYRVPGEFVPAAFGTAALAVLLAALLSTWLVKRDLDRVDMVSALKVRE